MLLTDAVLTHVSAAPALLASSGDSSSGGGFLFPFIAAIVVGVGFYWLIYNKYRNANARFQFEDRVSATVTNVRTRDDKVDHRTGLRSSTMDGRNEDDAMAKVPLQVAWPDPTALPAPFDGLVNPNDVPPAPPAPPAS